MKKNSKEFGSRPTITRTVEEKTNKAEFTIVEPVTKEESEAIFERTEVHGDEFNGQELTPEILREVGLLPKYKVKFGDKILLFSSYGYALGEGRIAVVAYVEQEGRMVPRSYYRSNSQGLWRYLPNYSDRGGRVDWYSKGYGEESITLPAAVQPALAQVTRPGSPILGLLDPELVFAGTARKLDKSGTYQIEVEPKFIKIGDFFDFDEYKIMPEKIDLSPEKYPDLDPGRSLAQWTQTSDRYGEIKMEAVPSNNNKFTFIFCRDNLNRVWVGSIEDDSQVQSTGLKKNWVNAGSLTTPAYEYASQTGGWGNSRVHSGEYVDMFQRYLSQIPVIRSYCKSRDIPLPPKRTLSNKEMALLISDATNFSQLFQALDILEKIKSTQGDIPSDNLKEIINRVRSGELGVIKITRTAGLRNKVGDLLAQGIND